MEETPLRLKTAIPGKKQNLQFKNAALNDFMSSDIFSPTTSPSTKLSMHKHSKMLTSQVPLASANRKMVEQALRSMERRQKSETSEQYS